ncbi:MAG: VOC family protein [Candidatus Bipolaricaulota bacterium]
MTYDSTRLLVTRFRECFRFYRDAIGLAPRCGTEDDTYADFATGATGISLFDPREMTETLRTCDRPPRLAAQDAVCLVFGVGDVDAVCDRLRTKGVAIVAPPTDHPEWRIRTAHVRDPEGNLIEINQPVARGL